MTDGRPALLGTLDANESIGPFYVRDFMALDSRVLTIIGKVTASGDGAITVEVYMNAAGTLGGATKHVMNTSNGYFLNLEMTRDCWLKFVMTGRNTDDVTLYAQ